jgi:type II secretory pathway component GspD/PulD (secretin)
MIVQDAQTLLLGGILFQKDSLVQRKLPGLGDLPGIGGLFRHEQVIKSNTELLVFITPRVIDEKMENVSDATKATIAEPREKLKKILGELSTGLEGLDQ